MQNEPCPLCERQDHEERFRHASYRLLTCQRCELHFISPYPVNEDVYDTVADYSYEDLEIISPQKHFESSKRIYDRFYTKIRNYCENAQFVLDVGCGTGELLRRLAEFPHLRRVGLELNQARAEFARTAAGCEIQTVPLEQFPAQPQSDVIIMMAVFSHVPHPQEFLTAIRSRLAPGGMLILYVGEYAKNVKKSAVFDWEIPDHLQFLGLNTVAWIAERYRFQIIQHDRVRLADEMFSKAAFESRGRSHLRNAIKATIVHVPGLLWSIRQTYKMIVRSEAYSSFIVLQANPHDHSA